MVELTAGVPLVLAAVVLLGTSGTGVGPAAAVLLTMAAVIYLAAWPLRRRSAAARSLAFEARLATGRMGETRFKQPKSRRTTVDDRALPVARNAATYIEDADLTVWNCGDADVGYVRTMGDDAVELSSHGQSCWYVRKGRPSDTGGRP